MKIIKIYPQSKPGERQRALVEKQLFEEGYKVESEEEIKEWSSGKACCLAIIFLPLIFFGKVKKVRVTYTKNG